jgi:hypothetical protein
MQFQKPARAHPESLGFKGASAEKDEHHSGRQSLRTRNHSSDTAGVARAALRAWLFTRCFRTWKKRPPSHHPEFCFHPLPHGPLCLLATSILDGRGLGVLFSPNPEDPEGQGAGTGLVLRTMLLHVTETTSDGTLAPRVALLGWGHKLTPLKTQRRTHLDVPKAAFGGWVQSPSPGFSISRALGR